VALGRGLNAEARAKPLPRRDSADGLPRPRRSAGALSELGTYYQKNGPRSRLSAEAAAGVLAHLDAVEAALPPEQKGLLGL
jgi:hypothetical protein